jgi:hypothetical protein
MFPYHSIHKNTCKFPQYFEQTVELLCQLLNVHGVNEVGQTEMHMSEPLGSESSFFELEISTENLKRYKSPGTDLIPAKLI